MCLRESRKLSEGSFYLQEARIAIKVHLETPAVIQLRYEAKIHKAHRVTKAIATRVLLD